MIPIGPIPPISELVHEVRGSEVSAFRECRLEWKWDYVEGWEPLLASRPLRFGGAFHCALEALYDPATWSCTLDVLALKVHKAFRDRIDQQVREYLERAEKYTLDPEEEVEIQEMLDLGKFMLDYLLRTLDRVEYTPILVEQEFQVPLGMRCQCDSCWDKFLKHHNEGDVWDGLPVVFGLRIDALFRDSKGSYWAVDHKSAAQLLNMDGADAEVLELDDQVARYMWALAYMFGLNISGFLYNQFRKVYPKPPKRLERLQLGRSFSVNKMQLTDYQTARHTFQTEDPVAFAAGLYDEYLAFLRDEVGNRFAQTIPVFKTPAQLQEAGDNLLMTVGEMLNPNLVLYRSPSKMNCRMCDFRGPCLSRTGGHDYQAELEASFVRGEPYYIKERRERNR